MLAPRSCANAPAPIAVRLAALQEKIPSAIIPLENLAVREVDLGGVLELGGSRFAFELYNPDNEVRCASGAAGVPARHWLNGSESRRGSTVRYNSTLRVGPSKQ